MRLELAFFVETNHYPSRFDEADMISAIADTMGVEESDVKYTMYKVIE